MEDDTLEIAYLGSGAHEEQLEKLADQFLWGDPEKINVLFFPKDASNILCRVEVQIESERRPSKGWKKSADFGRSAKGRTLARYLTN